MRGWAPPVLVTIVSPRGAEGTSRPSPSLLCLLTPLLSEPPGDPERGHRAGAGPEAELELKEKRSCFVTASPGDGSRHTGERLRRGAAGTEVTK